MAGSELDKLPEDEKEEEEKGGTIGGNRRDFFAELGRPTLTSPTTPSANQKTGYYPP
jgi:hypothetical protein